MNDEWSGVVAPRGLGQASAPTMPNPAAAPWATWVDAAIGIASGFLAGAGASYAFTGKADSIAWRAGGGLVGGVIGGAIGASKNARWAQTKEAVYNALTGGSSGSTKATGPSEPNKATYGLVLYPTNPKRKEGDVPLPGIPIRTDTTLHRCIRANHTSAVPQPKRWYRRMARSWVLVLQHPRLLSLCAAALLPNKRLA